MCDLREIFLLGKNEKGEVVHRAPAARPRKAHIGLQATSFSPQTINSFAGHEQNPRILLSFAGKTRVRRKRKSTCGGKCASPQTEGGKKGSPVLLANGLLQARFVGKSFLPRKSTFTCGECDSLPQTKARCGHFARSPHLRFRFAEKSTSPANQCALSGGSPRARGAPRSLLSVCRGERFPADHKFGLWER